MTRNCLANTILATALSFSAAHAATTTTTTINAGGSNLAGPTYIDEIETYTAANPTILFSYTGVGTTGGQAAFLNNDITQYKAPNVTASTLVYGTIIGTQVDFSGSDIPLAASQFTSAATGSYAKSSTSGPLIQIPTIGLPITMAYNVSKMPAAGLTLTDAQICGVLSGKITDWHTLVSTIPASTTINVVYFSNSAASTYLTTQHLATVCNATDSNVTFKTVKTLVSLFPNSIAPSNFVGENGSPAVAAQLIKTANSFGYLSPDYTSIAPLSTSTSKLGVAKVVNGNNGVAYAPTVANTQLALMNPGAGATDITLPTTLAAAMNPMNWSPADPQVKAGYPIVGYGTMELSTCYANPIIATAIGTFLKDQYSTAAYLTIIKNNGFTPLLNTAASAGVGTIENTFLTNTAGFNLNTENAKTCASYAGR